MSVLLVDSFDDRQTTDLSRKAVTDFDDGTIVIGGGVCGTNCFSDESIGNGIAYGCNESNSVTAQVGIALNPNDDESVLDFIIINNIVAQGKAFLRYDGADDSIEVWIGNNGILGVMFFKSAPGVQPPTTYVYHELRVLFDNAVGQIDYWADGVNLFSATGVDTIEDTFGGGGAFRHILLQTLGAQCLDDLYIMNGDGPAPTNASVSIGPAHVVALLPQEGPIGVGNFNEMTPSTGTDRGALMNEDPPNYDVDYLFANGEGERQLFRFPQIAVASQVVYAVQKEVFARMSDIGHGEVSILTESPALVLTEDRRWGLATQQVSTDVPQTSNYHYYLECDDLQGDAVTPWTIDDLNASQFGMRHYESFS